MLHAPISQIVSPSWDTWQTARFSVFARQSRVEVDTHKDLQDMLTKLEERKVSEDSTETRRIKDKKRRKFLQLALPCGAISVLCVIYCLVFISMAGVHIADAVQWKKYQGRFEALENVIKVVLAEYQARLAADDITSVPAQVYERTDAIVHGVLTTKTMKEWRLISSINDWRNAPVQAKYLKIANEATFYMKFISDLESIIYGYGLQLGGIKRWKLYYQYQRSSRKYVALQIWIGVFNAIRATPILLNYTTMNPEDNALVYKLIPKLSILLKKLLPLDSEFTNPLSTSFVLLSVFTSPLSPNSNVTGYLNAKDTEFKALEVDVLAQRLSQFLQLEDSNNDILKMAAFSFCISLFGLSASLACSAKFVAMIQDESRLAVLVADWHSRLECKVVEQKESTRCVLSRVVPRVLMCKYDTCQSMIPYQTSDTTLFMASIARFNSLFNLFSPSQVLSILTFVMELLDERMAQYNVYPVSRMGHYLIVISDSTERRHVEHACEVANLALDIMTCCSDLEIGRQSTSKLQMKIAIHSGACTGRLVMQSGAVQLKLLGSSLDILEHIHTAATPNMIHVSEGAFRHLNTCETYCLHYRGNINIRGDCGHRVYWLNGRRVSSVTAFDNESSCSRMGSWIELEKKPLYRLDEIDGTYEPVNKAPCKRYSQMSIGSYVPQMSPTVRIN